MLIKGDSLELLLAETIKPDLIVTDPPYAFGGSGGEHALSATVAIVLREAATRLAKGPSHERRSTDCRTCEGGSSGCRRVARSPGGADRSPSAARQRARLRAMAQAGQALSLSGRPHGAPT